MTQTVGFSEAGTKSLKRFRREKSHEPTSTSLLLLLLLLLLPLLGALGPGVMFAFAECR